MGRLFSDQLSRHYCRHAYYWRPRHAFHFPDKTTDEAGIELARQTAVVDDDSKSKFQPPQLYRANGTTQSGRDHSGCAHWYATLLPDTNGRISRAF